MGILNSELDRERKRAASLEDRVEQLEAAWERDQSVIEEQRQEIGRLRAKANQLQQKRRALADKLHEILREHDGAWHDPDAERMCAEAGDGAQDDQRRTDAAQGTGRCHL